MVTRVVAIDNIPFKEGGYIQVASSLHVKYSCQLCHMARELTLCTIHVPVISHITINTSQVLSNMVDDWGHGLCNVHLISYSLG